MDECYNLEYRFLPYHFVNGLDTLSYLVSRLAGPSYSDITGMIDRSTHPTMSGKGSWVIDNYLSALGDNDMIKSNELLNSIDLTVRYDGTSDPIIIPSSDSVMCYTSPGTHHPGFNSDYLRHLNFNYQNGAVINTFESFNGNSLQYPDVRRASQGLIAEFIMTGGTGGIAHAYEPGGIVADSIFFPAYSLGYNFVDAAYLGMPWVGRQNIVIGDPLLRIRDFCADTLTTDEIITSSTIECAIYVPPGRTLTIASGSNVNFIKNAHLKVDGNLIIEENSTVNFYGFSCFIVNNSLIVAANSSLNFYDFNRAIIAGDLYLENESELNIYNENKFIVNGTVSLNENTSINAFSKSEYCFNGTINFLSSSSLHFKDNSRLSVIGMTIPPSVLINFEDESTLNSNGVIELQANSLAILANLHTAQLILNEGTTLNFNSGSEIKINENLVMPGSSLNPIVINFSTSNKMIDYTGSSNLLIQYCQFNNGGIKINPSTASEAMNITISNTNFLSQTIPISIDGSRINYLSVQISNCNINNDALTGISVSNTELLNISNSTIIISNDVTAICIDLFNNGEVNINNCEFVNDGSGRSGTGINLYSRYLYGEQVREGQLLVQNCNFQKFDKSIFINQATESLTALSIKGSSINDCNDGIILVKVDEVRPAIKGNSFTNFWRQAINVNRGDQIDIYQNILLGNPNSAQNLIGINLSQVTNPYIINNSISGNGNTTPGSGIFEESCYGEIRKNTITGFTYGIELGGSSPRVAENEITGNITYGLYVSSDSHPDLGETQVGELRYPLTGYNNIHENGICNLLSNPEIFISRSTIDLKQGCNTIADDREDEPQYNCDFVILMDGKEPQEQVYAEKNYWGNHPVFGHNPEGRFGQGIDVIFDGYLEEPCTFSPGGGEILLLSNSLGEVYDTVYSSGVGSIQPTELELRYALANNYFYNGELTLAKLEYEGIVQNYGDEMSSLEAYNKIYEINNILNSSPETFLELKSYYLQQVSNQTDSLIMSTLTHLSNLCLVSAKEYGLAINNFDQIVQQNVNSDLALYRAIDALTTSLLISDDSTLNKNVAAKYHVSGFDDYRSKVRELLRTRKAGSIENWKENIPKEYSLYQNYPNPFNPSTKILYQMPQDGIVTLKIYDILGSEVATLVNEEKVAGKYEVNFNASSLASGVYIYKIQAGDFISAKKMMLLK